MIYFPQNIKVSFLEHNQAQDGAKYENNGDKNSKSWRGNGSESAEQIAIKQAFQHAWKGYKEFAWGHDMLKPMSRRYEDWFSTQTDHMGLTVSEISSFSSGFPSFI